MDMKDKLAEALRKIAHMGVKFDHRGDHSRRVVEIGQAALAEYDAQPAQAAQPVAIACDLLDDDDLPDGSIRWTGKPLPKGTKLYAQPVGVPDGWERASEWIADNYDDYSDVNALLRAMDAGATQPSAQPSADAESNVLR